MDPLQPAKLNAALSTAFDQSGIRHALAPVSAAASLYEEVCRLRERGLLAAGLFDSYREYWRFAAPDGVAEPRTLIVVAWQSSPLKIRFHLQEGPLDAVVPPTYISSQGHTLCLDLARSVLTPAGYGVNWCRVPVKLLAARSRLTQYGRNNIAYVAGLGSYVRLGALCTDAELGTTGWLPSDSAGTGAGLKFLDQCARCRACARACPTGCIPEDGTVIDAERCLTEANENPGDWPSWVWPDSHNALVGCMRCQQACPVNRPHLEAESELVAEFDRQETDLILQDLPTDGLPAALKVKLAALDLDEYSPVLGRNLRALRDATAASAN